MRMGFSAESILRTDPFLGHHRDEERKNFAHKYRGHLRRRTHAYRQGSSERRPHSLANTRRPPAACAEAETVENPMAKNQLSFFATKADLESLLRTVESKQQLQFVATGLFDSPDIEPMQSLLATPNLGHLSVADHNQGPCYLVASREVFIKVRAVPQRRGGVKYAVDQQENPKTIALRPSGSFGETCLIDGQVGTISDDPISLELFRLFTKEIRYQFTKINEFYVGKEAGELLDKGWRLTANAKSPALYDLKRD